MFATSGHVQEQKINVEEFGVGKAKPLSRFCQEIQRGAAGLMLDATNYKKSVRVVDVVLLRLSRQSGKILIQQSEHMENQEPTERLQLPGTKREPYKNRMVSDQRLSHTAAPEAGPNSGTAKHMQRRFK